LPALIAAPTAFIVFLVVRSPPRWLASIRRPRHSVRRSRRRCTRRS
jgi:hypothetical protein